jgi:hypothetical protein
MIFSLERKREVIITKKQRKEENKYEESLQSKSSVDSSSWEQRMKKVLQR